MFFPLSKKYAMNQAISVQWKLGGGVKELQPVREQDTGQGEVQEEESCNYMQD